MADATERSFEMNRPTIIALLYLLSFLAGITTIIGIILCYIWKDEPQDPWENSHFRYHIRTFWIGMVWTVAAFFASLATLFIGAPLFFGAVAVWFAIRAVKSLLAAQRREPVANVETWFF